MKTVKPTQTATLKDCKAHANRAEAAANTAKICKAACLAAEKKALDYVDAYNNTARRVIKSQIAYFEMTENSYKSARRLFWLSFALTVVNLTILFLR